MMPPVPGSPKARSEFWAIRAPMTNARMPATRHPSPTPTPTRGLVIASIATATMAKTARQKTNTSTAVHLRSNGRSTRIHGRKDGSRVVEAKDIPLAFLHPESGPARIVPA